MRLTFLQNFVPDFHSLHGREKYLKTILAGVTGARDKKAPVVDLDLADFIVGRDGMFRAEKRLEYPPRQRPLHGKPGEAFAAVFKLHALAQMGLHPCKIDIDERGIDHQQILFLLVAVDDQVVDHAAILIQEEGVLALADIEPLHVVCQEVIQPLPRAASADKKLPHVRNIKEPRRRAHGLVLVHDAGVLHRHVPSAESDDFCAEPGMFGMEGGSFQDGFG